MIVSLFLSNSGFMKKSFFLIAAFLLSLQIQAQDVMFFDALKEAGKTVKTLEADITRNIVKPDKQAAQMGKFYYQSTNEFAALFNNGEHIIVNETHLKIKLGMLSGTFKLKDGGRMRSLGNIFLYGLQGECQKLAQENELTISTEQDETYDNVVLLSKKKHFLNIGYKKIVLKFEKKSHLVKEFVLFDSLGNIDTYTISNVRYNVGVDKNRFQF